MFNGCVRIDAFTSFSTNHFTGTGAGRITEDDSVRAVRLTIRDKTRAESTTESNTEPGAESGSTCSFEFSTCACAGVRIGRFGQTS